jgi:hypothetical protein
MTRQRRQLHPPLRPYLVTYPLRGSFSWYLNCCCCHPQVTLLSADDVAVGCSTTHPPGRASSADIETALSTTALCSVTTDAHGKYTFTGIPCGQYSLQVRQIKQRRAFWCHAGGVRAIVKKVWNGTLIGIPCDSNTRCR